LKKTKSDVIVVNNSALLESTNPTLEGSTNQESNEQTLGDASTIASER